MTIVQVYKELPGFKFYVGDILVDNEVIEFGFVIALDTAKHMESFIKQLQADKLLDNYSSIYYTV